MRIVYLFIIIVYTIFLSSCERSNPFEPVDTTGQMLSLAMNRNYDDFIENYDDNLSSFMEDISILIDCDYSQVDILSVEEGSVIINFTIKEDPVQKSV